ncbi:MAG: ABC transporter ATP-binding protein [Candidatus Limiplasma sp.]|nr:ABC transporter ATP-binding protein [Candidatus Limiplasma sp.]
MSQIVLKNIDKFYGSNHVLKNLNLTVNDGEFMTLLGPSGCGKTTTLRVIAGLEKPQNGTIEMDGHLVVNAKELYFEDPGKRGMNLVFQSYALWPHMTVFQNVAFVLNVQKVPKEETKRRVMDALERMRIEQYADRYPSELSGGQQQRVAIAQAIVSQPKVLLLDEPLSNLDAKLRIDMRSEIKRLHHEMGTTIVYVTHDQVEALTMSTRIAIFFEGELEQVAAPMDLYQNPISLRVADFIGNPRINFVEGQAKRGEDGGLVVTSSLGRMSFTADCLTDELPAQSSFDVVLGIRPEKIGICSQNGDGAIAASVYATQPAGSETTIHLKMGDDSVVLAKEMGIRNYAVDQVVHVKIAPDKLNVFAKETGRLIKMAVPD